MAQSTLFIHFTFSTLPLFLLLMDPAALHLCCTSLWTLLSPLSGALMCFSDSVLTERFMTTVLLALLTLWSLYVSPSHDEGRRKSLWDVSNIFRVTTDALRIPALWRRPPLTTRSLQVWKQRLTSLPGSIQERRRFSLCNLHLFSSAFQNKTASKAFVLTRQNSAPSWRDRCPRLGFPAP